MRTLLVANYWHHFIAMKRCQYAQSGVALTIQDYEKIGYKLFWIRRAEDELK